MLSKEECAQPHSRRKFGLLEKQKDYIKRAKSSHKKEETILVVAELEMKVFGGSIILRVSHVTFGDGEENEGVGIFIVVAMVQLKIEMLTATLNSLGYQSSIVLKTGRESPLPSDS
ncbi:unnamed protein product [Fraxinus pennsylvanica]|uniref:Uncharacterized protein n=1 Tax=Fraxinus pennsylvanica TaxID=56036 RepID=A0AAD1ZBI7_9LAMI|nr:unnamed protein product [Fraxinus pennsylvanica]